MQSTGGGFGRPLCFGKLLKDTLIAFQQQSLILGIMVISRKQDRLSFRTPYTGFGMTLGVIPYQQNDLS